MKTIRVAAAVIRRDGLIFATQRGYGPYKDGWGEEFVQVEYDYPVFHLSMSCFLCSLLSGSLTLKEHESARWLRAEELDAVDWLPADRTAAASLRRVLSEENS